MSAIIAHFRAKKSCGEEHEQLTRTRPGTRTETGLSRISGGYRALQLEDLEKTSGYEWRYPNNVRQLAKEVSHGEDGKVHSDDKDADDCADDSNERGLCRTDGGVEGA